MTQSERVKILLVDDRPENLLALEAILEPLGQQLVLANSGEEVLRRLLSEEFAVILLDVQMPGMNGFETARLIKSRERSQHIPIIFLTAISKEESYVFEGYSVGAVDYISKPFQPDILRSKVGVFVDLYRKQRQLARQEQLLREHEKRELERRHEAELGETEARLAEIVDSALDAIITFDEDHSITLFNGAAERLFACPARDAIGQPIDEFFPPQLREDHLQRICADTSHGSSADSGHATMPARLEAFTGMRSGGEEFPIEASVSCLELPGRSRVFTIIARDISERRRAEEALRAQAISLANTTAELKLLNDQLRERQQALERAMSARTRFYASMSHELRTPINAILGYNTLLLEHIYGPLNEKQAEGLRRTQRAAKHLLELVNDVLDLSKIEAGKVDLKLEPVAFPSLIEDLFVTVRPMAEERGSTLTLEQRGGSVRVVTDPRRVRQILLNLLSNAIKFGRGKPIRVTCQRSETGGVEIAVVDEGDGIPEDQISRIFEEFVQLSRGQNHEGTGLGLPISRRLAQLLHGELDVASMVGQGSTFTLRLPASADWGREYPEPSDASEPVDEGALEPAGHAETPR